MSSTTQIPTQGPAHVTGRPLARAGIIAATEHPDYQAARDASHSSQDAYDLARNALGVIHAIIAGGAVDGHLPSEQLRQDYHRAKAHADATDHARTAALDAYVAVRVRLGLAR